MNLISKILFCFTTSIVLNLTSFAASSEKDIGTKKEAKNLLNRATNLVKVNEVVAFTMMTIPNSGFHLKDLYPFCFDKDGILLSHPYNLGASLKDFKSEDGTKIGMEMLNKAKTGEILEISYTLPIFKNGALTEKKAMKTALYTKVNDYICASGYYPK